jgi:DNA-binding NtrC family response regulator
VKIDLEHPPRILIVEDDQTLADVLTRALKSEGYAVERACDLSEGHWRLERSVCDTLLLDLHLPDGEGPALLAPAQARQPWITGIVMSGQLPDNRIEAWLSLPGVVDCLQKPFSILLLRYRILRAVETARLRRAVGRLWQLSERHGLSHIAEFPELRAFRGEAYLDPDRPFPDQES